MCHICFTSTTVDSWSRFRVHAVIFHRVSAPLNSWPVFVSRSDAGPSCHIRLSVCGFLWPRACREDGQTATQNKISHTHTAERKRMRTRGTERQRRNEEKAYYQQTDGPPNSQWPHGDLEGQLFAPPGYQRRREGRGA